MENRFDQEASVWDEKPTVLEIASKAAEAICSHIPLNSNMVAMDFGCGVCLFCLNMLFYTEISFKGQGLFQKNYYLTYVQYLEWTLHKE